MARKLCTNCNTRPIDKMVAGPDMCTECLEYTGWENTHIDDAHGTDHEGSNDTSDCPVCHPELDPRTSRTSHTNTVAKTYRSHAECGHPRTPKDRAVCRKAGGPKVG